MMHMHHTQVDWFAMPAIPEPNHQAQCKDGMVPAFKIVFFLRVRIT